MKLKLQIESHSLSIIQHCNYYYYYYYFVIAIVITIVIIVVNDGSKSLVLMS